MKYVLFGLSILVSVLFGFFWVVAPAPMKDKVVGLITFASVERQCFNYYKNEDDYFKDPDSAYIQSSKILTKKDNYRELKQYVLPPRDKTEGRIKGNYDSVVVVRVMSKNSMGGYGGDDIYCALDDGRFDGFQYLLDKSAYESRLRHELETKPYARHLLSKDHIWKTWDQRIIEIQDVLEEINREQNSK